MLTGNSLRTMTDSARSSIEKLCQSHPIFDIFGNACPIGTTLDGASSKSSATLSHLFHQSVRMQDSDSTTYFKVRVDHLRPDVQKLKFLPPQYTPVQHHVFQDRQRTVRSIERVIQSRFGAKYRVACFGSTCYGVDNAQSDLDLVVVVRPYYISQCCVRTTLMLIRIRIE